MIFFFIFNSHDLINLYINYCMLSSFNDMTIKNLTLQKYKNTFCCHYILST